MRFINHVPSCLALACAVLSVGAQAAFVTVQTGQTMIVRDPLSGSRNTQLALNGGAGQLAFNPGSGFNGSDPSTIGGIIGALNVGKVQLSAITPAVYSEQTLEDEFGDIIRVGAQANAPVTSVTLDDLTGAVVRVDSAGGARQVGTRISGTLNGGQADVSNLRFDLQNKVVYADLVGRSAAVGTRAAVDYVSLNTALWTFSMVTGPTTLPPSALLSADPVAAMKAAGFTVEQHGGLYYYSATNVISGLKVTQAGFDFFKNSLGLLSTGVDALNAVNNDPRGWGSVTSTLTFSPQIPEPSTWATMALGLAAVAIVARQRRRDARR